MPNLERLLASLLLVILCLSAPALAQSLPSDDEVVAQADTVLTSLTRVSGIGGAVLLARGDRILLSRGYGLADAEHAVANRPDTVFRIASISKTFTGAAIAKLQEQQRLSVDDPFCNYLPACPPAWRPIRIRQLLQHSSGIPNFTDLPFFMEGKRLPGAPRNIASRLASLPLAFAPGTQFSYSNSNYLLLGMVIEQTAGVSYEVYLRDSFFAPLRLTRTRGDTSASVVRDRARGYAWAGSEARNADPVEMALHQGNGGLLSTVEDLHRWVRGLHAGLVLNDARRTEMWAAAAGDYGYGWGVGRSFNRPYVGHSGLIDGFSTQLSFFPDDDVTVILLLNNQAGEAPLVAETLAGIMFGHQTMPVPVPEATRNSYVGEYGSGVSKIRVARLGDELTIQAAGLPPEELVAESPTRFAGRRSRQTFDFAVDAAGRVTELVIPSGGFSRRYPRSN